jgi:RNA polymerase sigma-70 factor (ECF subfamily)
MERTDEALLAAYARAGDRGAADELIRRTQTAVYRIAFRILHDEAAAEDAVQETFLGVLRSAADFREGSSVRTWIYRIAVNVALDASRRRRARKARERSAAAMNSRPTIPAETLQALEQAVSRLPDEDRAAVALRFEQGLALKEVAAALGCAPGTVPSRLERALGRLRGLLAGSALATLAVADLEAQLSRLPAPALPETLPKRLATLAASRGLTRFWSASLLPKIGVAVVLVAAAAGSARALRVPRPEAPPALTLEDRPQAPGPQPSAAPAASATKEVQTRWVLRTLCRIKAMWTEASDCPSPAFWRELVRMWDEALADPAMASAREKLIYQRELWEGTRRVYARVQEGLKDQMGASHGFGKHGLLPFLKYREAGYRIEGVWKCNTTPCPDPGRCELVFSNQFFYPPAKVYPPEAIANDAGFLWTTETRLGLAIYYHLNWTHHFAERAIDASRASADQVKQVKFLVSLIQTWGRKFSEEERHVLRSLLEDGDAAVRRGADLFLEPKAPPAVVVPPPPVAPAEVPPASREEDLLDPNPQVRGAAFDALELSLRTPEKTPLAREMFARFPDDGPASWYAKEVVQRTRQDEAAIRWSAGMLRIIADRTRNAAIRAEAELVLQRLDHKISEERELKAGEAERNARSAREAAEVLGRWQGHEAAEPALRFFAAWARSDRGAMADGVADRLKRLPRGESTREQFLDAIKADAWRWRGQTLGDVFALDALRVMEKEALREALSTNDVLFRHTEPDLKNHAKKMLALMEDDDVWVVLPFKDGRRGEHGIHVVFRRFGSAWKIAISPP